MKKDDTVYLRHIFDAILTIEEYTKVLLKMNFSLIQWFMMQ
jgi:uncharacterized protein with HEPN domain